VGSVRGRFFRRAVFNRGSGGDAETGNVDGRRHPETLQAQERCSAAVAPFVLRGDRGRRIGGTRFCRPRRREKEETTARIFENVGFGAARSRPADFDEGRARRGDILMPACINVPSAARGRRSSPVSSTKQRGRPSRVEMSRNDRFFFFCEELSQQRARVARVQRTTRASQLFPTEAGSKQIGSSHFLRTRARQGSGLFVATGRDHMAQHRERCTRSRPRRRRPARVQSDRPRRGRFGPQGRKSGLAEQGRMPGMMGAGASSTERSSRWPAPASWAASHEHSDPVLSRVRGRARRRRLR